MEVGSGLAHRFPRRLIKIWSQSSRYYYPQTIRKKGEESEWEGLLGLEEPENCMSHRRCFSDALLRRKGKFIVPERIRIGGLIVRKEGLREIVIAFKKDPDFLLFSSSYNHHQYIQKQLIRSLKQDKSSVINRVLLWKVSREEGDSKEFHFNRPFTHSF